MPRSSLLILLLLLAVSGNIFSQTYPSIGKKEIYYFLEHGFFEESNNKFILIQEPIKINVADTTIIFNDSMFSSRDYGFIKKQLKNPTLVSWETFANAKLMKKALNPREFWEKDKVAHKTYTGVAEISVPVFSLDKSKCMVVYHWYCGNQCNDIGYYYYQKVKNKWEFNGELHQSHE